MTHTVDQVASGEPDRRARDTLTRRHAETYQAWVRQQALAHTSRDAFDAGPGDEIDHATIRAQRDEQAVLADALRAHLDDLNAAIRRREEGTYGVCEDCRCEIPAERLQLFPAATRCVACQRQREHHR
jgi:DnaK suppressor protein